MLDLFGSRRKSLIDRLAERFLDAVEQASSSAQRTSERAAGSVGEARRRTRTHLRDAGERARSGARQLRDAGERTWAGARERRDELSERMESISRRAAEIREARQQRREARRQRRALRRPRARRATPMQLDVRRDDKIVLRGRRPINVRATDGSTIRYRYYERPGFWLRTFLHLTGRQVWPRR